MPMTWETTLCHMPLLRRRWRHVLAVSFATPRLGHMTANGCLIKRYTAVVNTWNRIVGSLFSSALRHPGLQRNIPDEDVRNLQVIYWMDSRHINLAYFTCSVWLQINSQTLHLINRESKDASIHLHGSSFRLASSIATSLHMGPIEGIKKVKG